MKFYTEQLIRFDGKNSIDCYDQEIYVKNELRTLVEEANLNECVFYTLFKDGEAIVGRATVYVRGLDSSSLLYKTYAIGGSLTDEELFVELADKIYESNQWSITMEKDILGTRICVSVEFLGGVLLTGDVK